MKLSRKKVSPTFQPYLLASFLPTTAPRRSSMKAWYCSFGISYSGYMAR